MIKRAPVKWFGGKGIFKSKILPLIPYTSIFVEPYGGAGNILMAREQSEVEVYNDLNNRLVNLMRAIQDPVRMRKLRKRLAHTLYSLGEFQRAIEILRDTEADADDAAWAFYVGQNQGFAGITPKSIGNWGKHFHGPKIGAPGPWLSLMDLLPEWHRRLMRVQVDSRDALQVIRYWDSPDTTFYLDPPYVHGTRKDAKVYEIEATDSHHVQLVDTILACQGAVVLSGYNHPIYKSLEEHGWEKRSFNTTCTAAVNIRGSKLCGTGSGKLHLPRVEVVWRNPKAVELFNQTEKEEAA